MNDTARQSIPPWPMETFTREEAVELKRLRANLGLSEPIAAHVAGVPSRDGYLALFRQLVLDGALDHAGIDKLRLFRESLGIGEKQAAEIIRADAVSLYRQLFYQAIQDGAVTPQEEQTLRWLKDELWITDQTVHHFEEELNRVKQRAAYRAGTLPSVKTRMILEGGEICHWDSPCEFAWATATTAKSCHGSLVLTSGQIMFTSPARNLSFKPSKVVDVELFGNGLRVQTSTNRGTGLYLVDDPADLEAVLVGLVKKHKYLQSESFSCTMTRHIPDDVKRAVWDRDGGRCVRCGDMQYLEFDHIIPHARGGANTVGNVQLLCRKCNLLKSDRI